MIIEKYKLVFKQIALLLCLYAFTRLLFLVFNYSYFAHSESTITPFLFGLRFDLVVICWLNGLLFLVILLPFKFTEHAYFKRIYQILFVSINALALLFNCIDIGYFEFIQKRSTFDLFQTLGGENDGMQLLPQYIADYLHVLLIWISIITALIYFSKSPNITLKTVSPKAMIVQLISIFIIFLPLLVLGSRGGWQYRPIDMITASNYAQGKHVSLVLNSPFCIMKSANRAQLEPLKFLPEKQVKELFSPFHYHKDTTLFQPKNVVFIIMESFGSEYTQLANDKESLTPFLDSLATKSTQFTNAYANGKTSIKGIPAIVAGIPTLFDGSFTYSAYNANSFESIATSLKKKGYSTSFFHGGNNGTMGFDVFAKAAGFDHYVGRKEYPKDTDYDGHWGIYDEPFFQFFKHKLDQEKKPFAACFFSLSSHHPYSLPEQYQNKFKGNSLEIGASIQYADYALAQFFKSAEKSAWYKNTLFVITADHTSISKNEQYQTDAGIYSIPLLIYDPKQAQGEIIEKPIQQIDILPSVLEQLNYDLPYFAYGNDFRRAASGYAISFNGQYYQLITAQYCLQFDGEKTIAVYNMKEDKLLKDNLINKAKTNFKKEEELLKAIIQTYNQSLIENKMTVKN
jgi:phosphoglycerol transferase MdoB-like AlkP superfamily enzyme